MHGLSPNAVSMVCDCASAYAAAMAHLQRIFLAHQLTPAERIQALYDAYLADVMTPDEVRQYEGDVLAGVMVLPPGAILKTATALAVYLPAGEQ